MRWFWYCIRLILLIFIMDVNMRRLQLDDLVMKIEYTYDTITDFCALIGIDIKYNKSYLSIKKYDKHGKIRLCFFTVDLCFKKIRNLSILMIWKKVDISFLIKRAGDVEENPGPDNCNGCGILIDDTKDTSIKCEICAEWSHKKCAGLTDADFRTMSKKNFYWICGLCGPNLKAMNRLKSIDEKIDRFMVGLSKLEEDVTTQKITIKKHEDQISEILSWQKNFECRITKVEGVKSNETNETGNMKQGEKTEIQSILKEIEDEKERQNNVILFGIKLEEADEQGNLSAIEEKKYLREMVKFFEIKVDVDKMIIQRFGKVNDRGERPILLTFDTVKEKWNFFFCYKKLKANPGKYKGVFISLDKTKKQREDFAKLKAEMLERNKKGENLKIVKGKLVKCKSDPFSVPAQEESLIS